MERKVSGMYTPTKCPQCYHLKQIDLLDYNTWGEQLCKCTVDPLDHCIGLSHQNNQCAKDMCNGQGRQWGQCQDCDTEVHTRCMDYAEFQTYRDGVFNCNSCRRNKSMGNNSCNQIPDVKPTLVPPTYAVQYSPQGLTGPDRTVLLPTFAGHEAEDPHVFLDVCEEKLTRHRVHKDDWSELIANRLRGPAASWWGIVKEYQVSWDTFRERLLTRFEVAGDTIQLHAKLYHEQQKEREGIEEFVHRKLALFRRLLPDQPTVKALGIIVALAAPDIRPQLRQLPQDSVEQFTKAACVCEKDMRACQEYLTTTFRHHTSKTPKSPVVLPDVSQPPPPYLKPEVPIGAPPRFQRRDSDTTTGPHRQGAVRPPPRCRYCPGEEYHWHQNCPNNPRWRSGN